MTDRYSRPAVLGGTPVRPEGPPAWPISHPDIATAVTKCLQSGDWGKYNGPATLRLQEQLSDLCQVPHVILCSSGTSAVELALRGLLIGPGDEVLLSAYDFKGNFLNIVHLGAIPVLIDVHPQTGQLDLDRVEEALSPKTRAIIASHLHGGVVDITALRHLIGDRQIAILEDACQLPGAPLSGTCAGTAGDVGVLSFGGSKLLSSGRGGAVLTARADVAARIALQQQRGNLAYPLSELQAAVVLPQLELLPDQRTQRQKSAASLSESLMTIPGLRPWEVPIPEVETDFYKFAFSYSSPDDAGLSRDQLASALRAEGLAVYPGFRGLHLIHARRRFRAVDGKLTAATTLDRECLVLHHPILLEGATGVAQVLEAVHKVTAAAVAIRESGVRIDCQPAWGE